MYLGVKVEGELCEVCNSMWRAEEENVWLPASYQLPHLLAGIVEGPCLSQGIFVTGIEVCWVKSYTTYNNNKKISLFSYQLQPCSMHTYRGA